MSQRIVDTGREPPVSALQALAEASCPDCDADYVLHDDPDNPMIWHLDVHHDATCPSYAGVTR